jgi:flagellar motor switch protein FliN/FliY
VGGYLDQQEIDLILKDMKRRAGMVKEEVRDIALKPPGDEEKQPFAGGEKEKKPLVEKVEFAPFHPRRAVVTQKPEISFFDNICLVVSGELGSTEITVRELLKLEEGSVIKLDKVAGESASILLNGQFLGHAEVVVINDRFGLRITAIGNGDTEAAKED